MVLRGHGKALTQVRFLLAAPDVIYPLFYKGFIMIIYLGDEMKKRYILFLILLIIAIFSLLFFTNKKTNNKDDDYAELFLYNIGNSNIEIIKKDNTFILINTGLEEDRYNLLKVLNNFEFQKIDYLILTNRNDEYIGNVSYLLDNYNVDYLYINDFAYESKKVEELENTIVGNYVDSIILSSTENIRLDILAIDIYPGDDDEASMEDKTLVVKASIGNNNIYLASNASSYRLENLDKSYLLVSENKSLFDIPSKYYLYDGKADINENNLLKRDLHIVLSSHKVAFK